MLSRAFLFYFHYPSIRSFKAMRNWALRSSVQVLPLAVTEPCDSFSLEGHSDCHFSYSMWQVWLGGGGGGDSNQTINPPSIFKVVFKCSTAEHPPAKMLCFCFRVWCGLLGFIPLWIIATCSFYVIWKLHSPWFQISGPVLYFMFDSWWNLYSFS